MEFKECECGCGKQFPLVPHNRKYVDRKHREKHMRLIKRRKLIKGLAETKRELSPEQRWEEMSLYQRSAEGVRIHKTYGQMQTMYYLHTLPADFGLNIFEN